MVHVLKYIVEALFWKIFSLQLEIVLRMLTDPPPQASSVKICTLGQNREKCTLALLKYSRFWHFSTSLRTRKSRLRNGVKSSTQGWNWRNTEITLKLHHVSSTLVEKEISNSARARRCAIKRKLRFGDLKRKSGKCVQKGRTKEQLHPLGLKPKSKGDPR